MEEALLSVLAAVTALGVIVALAGYRRQSSWRRKDQIRLFVRDWASAVRVPGEDELLQSKNEEFTLSVEKHAYFPLAQRMVSRDVRQRFKKFKSANAAYISRCRALYKSIREEGMTRASLPVAPYSDSINWPDSVLFPAFMLTIYPQVLEMSQAASRPEDILYDIDSFKVTGQELTREGMKLAVTYDGYDKLTLAEAPEVAILNRARKVHREMMGDEFCKKFLTGVTELRELKGAAETAASDVRSRLTKFEVS